MAEICDGCNSQGAGQTVEAKETTETEKLWENVHFKLVELSGEIIDRFRTLRIDSEEERLRRVRERLADEVYKHIKDRIEVDVEAKIEITNKTEGGTFQSSQYSPSSWRWMIEVLNRAEYKVDEVYNTLNKGRKVLVGLVVHVPSVNRSDFDLSPTMTLGQILHVGQLKAGDDSDGDY